MATIKKTRTSGAGVKAIDGVQDLERTQVRLDPKTKKIMKKIGGGNVSLGIREAGRRLEAKNDTRKYEPDQEN